MPQHSSQTYPPGTLIELATTDSTNNYALNQIHEGLTRHGTAYFAREQTAGKGQRGKTWLAAKDSSLLVSIVIDPKPLVLTQQFWLSACAAVTACDFFNSYTNGNMRVKWPNDIYWQDRKAGGILIENIIGEGTWRWAVVGIGLNINQTSFPETLQNPISLRQITGRSYVPVDLARQLCISFNNNFRQLSASGFDDLHTSYIDLLYKKNEGVKLKKGGRVFEGTIKSVSTSGSLIVEHGIEEEFEFGEIEWVIPK